MLTPEAKAKAAAAAAKGREAQAKMRRDDPDYFKQIGRMGGLAKKRRAESDAAFAAKVARQNRRASQLGGIAAGRLYAAGKIVIEDVCE